MISSTISIVEIAFTGYPVTDLARARAFYEGVLNLRPSTTFGEADKQWIEYDVGPSTLAITSMSPEWKPSSQGPAVALELADFDSAIETVRAAGTKFLLEPMTYPSCKLAVVTDPDGNAVALHQRASV